MASTLHEHERRILQALRERGSASVEELQRLTGLSRGAVEKASAWAETKGVVEIEEEAYEVLRLTDEGYRYVEEGLPEKRLIKTVSEGVEEIESLRRRIEPLEIALAWARRRGWINIRKGRVTLTDEGIGALGEETLDERLLQRAVEGLRVEKLKPEEAERAEQLRRRGLLRAERHIRRTIHLTELGREVLPHLEEAAERVITQLTPELLRSGAWRGARLQRYDVKLPAPRVYPGKKHFIRQVIDYIRRFWVELGFKEMKGPTVEMAFFNFDSLYTPQDHPAREIFDIYFVKSPNFGDISKYEVQVENVKETHESGWKTGSKGWSYKFSKREAARLLLRGHGTALSARTLISEDLEIPGKYFSIVRCYRPELVDKTHLSEFNQVEGIIVDEELTLRDLLGILSRFAIEIAGADKVRFRPDYFPFTEPSVELSAYKEGYGWMEFGGSGIFRPEVTLPLGISVPVIAWGLGVDRLFMMKAKIDDIRYLFTKDLEWLRNKELI